MGFGQDKGLQFTTVNIYDEQLKKEKELYREPSWYNEGKDLDVFASRSAFFFVAENRIFVEKEKKEILCFDSTGKKIFSFIPDIKPLKVSQNQSRAILKFFQNVPQFKPYWEALKNRLKVPSHYPNINFWSIKDGKMYILTYHKKDSKREVLIYNLRGKLMSRVFIRFRESNPLLPDPYDFKENTFYQLAEKDDERWELYISRIQ
jgi:hypothetical protein